jgi:hypothetical protein
MPRAKTSAKTPTKVARSPKAGAPPADPPSPSRVRRRQKRARAALSKGTTLFETDHGPRAAWPASVSKRRKR